MAEDFSLGSAGIPLPMVLPLGHWFWYVIDGCVPLPVLKVFVVDIGCGLFE
jgi:hypothetical protein